MEKVCVREREQACVLRLRASQQTTYFIMLVSMDLLVFHKQKGDYFPQIS